MSDEPAIEAMARAVYAVINPQAAGHPLTDYDSEYGNRRGDYMGIVVPSLVDTARDVAKAALTAYRAVTCPS